MSNTLAMFPGQGSQHVGMGKEIHDKYEVAKAVFREANKALDFDVEKMCFEGPEEDLMTTSITQPCLVTISTAYWRVMQELVEGLPTHFAGHSLGEYSALVAAGRLDFGDALNLVHQRGLAMQRAAGEGVGAMAAIINCPQEELEAITAAVDHAGHNVQIANYNSPQQLVISGHRKAVDEVVEKVKAAKYLSMPLKVNIPFHSPLLSQAKEEMTEMLESTTFSPAANTVYPNVDAKPTKSYDAHYLVEQIDSPVRWLQTLVATRENGVEDYVEFGAGKVLCGLVRRCLGKEYRALASSSAPVIFGE